MEIFSFFQELSLSQTNFHESTKHEKFLDVIVSSFPERTNSQYLKSNIRIQEQDSQCGRYYWNIDQLVTSWTNKVKSYINELLPKILPQSFIPHPKIDSIIKHLSN